MWDFDRPWMETSKFFVLPEGGTLSHIFCPQWLFPSTIEINQHQNLKMKKQELLQPCNKVTGGHIHHAHNWLMPCNQTPRAALTVSRPGLDSLWGKKASDVTKASQRPLTSQRAWPWLVQKTFVVKTQRKCFPLHHSSCLMDWSGWSAEGVIQHLKSMAKLEKGQKSSAS